jgi:phage baseplate assembly protein W
VRSISFPFQFTTSKHKVVETKTYDEVVRAQVIDALMTNQGERVFRPRYGCDVQSALFDPRDELVRQDAAALLTQRLEEFVPRCMVRSINFTLPPDDSTVLVNIVYRPAPTATDVALSIPLPSSEYIARSRVPVPDELTPSTPGGEE